MEFNPKENKEDFRKMMFIIGGVILVAGLATAFIVLRKDSKQTFNLNKPVNLDNEVSPTAEVKPIFSQDITTWKNYNWSGKINTHYPKNWQLKEVMNGTGVIIGLEIIPSTGNTDDTIFIGGDLVKCSTTTKYIKSSCLKNNIQMPFYTNSKNTEVLNAFDLIFQNSILTDEEK
jgi:hypothetical protein